MFKFHFLVPMGVLDDHVALATIYLSLLSFCRSPNFFSSSIFRRVLGTNFYNNRDHNTDIMKENSREYFFSVQTIHSKCTLLTFLDFFYYINGCFLNQKFSQCIVGNSHKIADVGCHFTYMNSVSVSTLFEFLCLLLTKITFS